MPIEILLLLKRTKDSSINKHMCVCVCVCVCGWGGWHMYVQTQ